MELPLDGSVRAKTTRELNAVNLVNLLDNIDALPRARFVPILILLAGAEVVDAHILDHHGVRASIVVDLTTSPFDRSLRIVRVTSRPDTNANIARRLRERTLCAILRLIVGQGPEQLAVDPPLNLVLGPVGGVVVEFGVGVVDLEELAVLVVGDTLAVVVGLDLGGVVANPFPVNLVQVVRLQHDTTDDTSTGSHLDVHFDDAEEDVEGGLDCGRFELLVDGEFGALVGVDDFAIGDVPDLLIESAVEGPGVVCSQRWVGVTFFLCGITVSPCLGNGWPKAGREEGQVSKEGHLRGVSLWAKNNERAWFKNKVIRGDFCPKERQDVGAKKEWTCERSARGWD